MLAHAGRGESEIARLIAGLASPDPTAGLEEPERAMVAYALKLTATPGQMEEADVTGLRAVGFDDRAIHDICAVTAYFAFVNRIADGLGVELEAEG